MRKGEIKCHAAAGGFFLSTPAMFCVLSSFHGVTHPAAFASALGTRYGVGVDNSSSWASFYV